jgi:hypothetical protein
VCSGDFPFDESEPICHAEETENGDGKLAVAGRCGGPSPRRRLSEPEIPARPI